MNKKEEWENGYKSIITATFACLIVVSFNANAAFLAPGTSGRIELLSGCFAFGDCSTGLPINIVDNGITSGGWVVLLVMAWPGLLILL